MKIKMLKKYVYLTACYGSGWRKAKQYAKQYASANQIPARAAIRLARGYWLDVRSTRHLMRANNTVLSASFTNAVIQGNSATLIAHDDLTDASSYLFH